MSNETEIWVADFEFNGADGGDNPHPVCFCAIELNSKTHLRIWLDGIETLEAPIDFNDPAITYVAFYSAAEFSCHLVLGWAIPKNIIDLFCEWRVLTNDGVRHERGYNGLLNVCNHFDISAINQEYKDRMRDRVLRGAPFTDAEKQEILDYCDTDIIETAALFEAMRPLIDNWHRALFRGQYMSIIAQIEHAGVPLDVETLALMRENWDTIKLELITEISKDFDFFENLTFKTQAFEEYLFYHDMAWPRTGQGNLKMDDDTWKEMCIIYPVLQPVREVRAMLGRFKKLQVACGSDGRNRGMLAPLGTKTGRNAPKVECVFTNPSWLRCLIKPEAGKALAYIDYSAQEFFIAAVLSEDKNMLDAYNTGDPYLQFAKSAGAVPPEGTKKSHKPIRDRYKQACLAVQYGQRAPGLAIRINKPLADAQEIIRQHQRLFPRYWALQEDTNTQAKLHKSVHTRFGWYMQVTQGTSKEDSTLRNFFMQSTGADILKVACYLLTVISLSP